MPLLILVILSVLAVGIVALLSPVHVHIVHQRDQSQVRATYLGLSVVWDRARRRTEYGMFGRCLFSRPWRESPRPIRRAITHETPTGPRIRTLWSSRAMILRAVRVVARLTARLWRTIRLESGRIELTFGLGDPAQTGMAVGYAHALSAICHSRWPNLDWRLEPDFTRRVCQLGVMLHFRIVPLRPLVAMVEAAARFPWQGLWRLKRNLRYQE